jgi:hypothetical protein
MPADSATSLSSVALRLVAIICAAETALRANVECHVGSPAVSGTGG